MTGSIRDAALKTRVPGSWKPRFQYYGRPMNVQWTAWEQRVLDTFLDGDTIVQFPAKQKKRKVILKWMTIRIPSETKISRADFNRLLKRHHPDSATSRRELFEFGYVHRDRDFYWRDATLSETHV
ncbi:DUF2087 domain-containing protein [Candidatus Bipolaricaulota bacterium]|nr:DUF2087 domain-containing protein [Candidatus Bipolaricaulota bacterium]